MARSGRPTNFGDLLVSHRLLLVSVALTVRAVRPLVLGLVAMFVPAALRAHSVSVLRELRWAPRPSVCQVLPGKGWRCLA